MIEVPIMIEVYSELSAVEEYINLMELRAPFLAAQLGDRIFHQLKDDDDDDDRDTLEELQYSCQYVGETTFLHNIRSSIVIMLWSTYESNIVRIAERWKRKNRNFNTILRRNSKDSFLERATKYYEETMNIKLTQTEDDYKQLQVLYMVRNALAHGNGYKESVSKYRWRELQVLERNMKGVTTDAWQVKISESFVREGFSTIRNNLRWLSNQLSASL